MNKDDQIREIAQTMKEWSDTAGDHHWQAGCVIEQLHAEVERLRDESERRRRLYIESETDNNSLLNDRQKLKQERDRLKANLSAYQSAMNKIDEWFEYGNESRADRCRVHKILSELTDQLRQQAKEAQS